MELHIPCLPHLPEFTGTPVSDLWAQRESINPRNSLTPSPQGSDSLTQIQTAPVLPDTEGANGPLTLSLSP